MARIDHTDDELIEALRQLKQYGTQTKAAMAIGVPFSTFCSRIQTARARGLTADTNLKRTQEQEIKNLQRKLKAAQAEADTAEKVRTVIYDLAETSPTPPRWVSKPTSVKKEAKNQRDIPMTIWSDWHWSEVVNKIEVGGVNEFNSEIAKVRVQRLVDNTVDLVKNHMPCKNAPGMVICLGGDMISGDIHEELQDTNDKYTQQAVLELQDVLASALTHMADEFGNLFVPCVVGNHGRMTKKPRHKGRVYTSFEWNLYNQLERYFRNDKRITFFIPGETDAYFTVAGHRFLLTHGDSLGVRGGDGIIGALGPITRGAIKTGRSEAQIGRDFDTIVMGHWHQYLSLPGIIVNNCLKGYDDFARLALRAPARPASQALWGVHPKWGITSRWEIFVQDPIHPVANDIGWVAVRE